MWYVKNLLLKDLAYRVVISDLGRFSLGCFGPGSFWANVLFTPIGGLG